MKYFLPLILFFASSLFAQSGVPISANQVLAGPASGPASEPLYRALVTADMPSGIVSGSGTTNTVPKFTAASVLGDSSIDDDGTDISSTASVAAGRTLSFINSENATATSDAQALIQVGGSSGGDAYTEYAVSGVQSYVVGIDNSLNDNFVIGRNASVGTNTVLSVTQAGLVGINDGSPEVLLTVQTNDSGVTPSGNADELFIENSVTAGMTIGSGTTGNGFVYFADSGDNDVGGIQYSHSSNYMSFTTNASEAMRIDSSGRVGVGRTSSNWRFNVDIDSNSLGACEFRNTASSGTVRGINVQLSGQSPNDSTSYFAFFSDSSSNRFIFYSNGGLHNYQANDVNLSDRRTKSNIVDLEDSTDFIDSIKFKKFDQNGHKNIPGVIAQDIKQLDASLVTRFDSNSDLEGIYSHRLYMRGMKALQEAIRKIKRLETRIAALETLHAGE